MEKFGFDEPPMSGAADISAECRCRLMPLVNEIVEAAVAAGWNRDDVLLALVELAWDLHETRRADQ
ncbi:hypothetical protein RFM41_05005 [Mesorhizobium sp. VK25A]|uniref:Uncharacterized protein n=1 Tax=Mesorhizobium vachelliae TaxID=3072309 RepID=A0ABU5A0G4_9HYPH|nr:MULTISPECIES: hypothetical protein [unclassified Mesorhizobium]MDX8531165.1 hypothetical protein [Mesorhizobium sp. VK25D]MDX8543084.1 hypothetical protein [Mesorhizobium sp. VK25A]